MADERTIELVFGETVPVVLYVKRDGVGVDLTGATVTFSAIWVGEYLGVQFSMEQPTTQTATSTVVIDGASCTPDADQTANPGKFTWTPTTTTYLTAVEGHYRYQTKVVFANSTVQYYPRNPMDERYRLTIHPAYESLN